MEKIRMCFDKFAKGMKSTFIVPFYFSLISFFIFMILIWICIPPTNVYPEDEYTLLKNVTYSTINFEDKILQVSNQRDNISINVHETNGGFNIVTDTFIQNLNIALTTELSQDFEVLSETRNYNSITSIYFDHFFHVITLSAILTVIVLCIFDCICTMHNKKNTPKDLAPFASRKYRIKS